MCISATMMLVAGAAVSAVGAISEGKQAKKQGQFQQQQAMADAQAEREAASLRGDKIRDQGRRQKSAARASLAKSGVVADAGSALEIQENIIEDSESDAISEILGAGYASRKIEQQGEMARISGNNAFTSGILGAGKSALSAGYEYQKAGWIKQQQPKTT